LGTVDYVIPIANWPRIRDTLLTTNVCNVSTVFSMSDKQFQSMAISVKPPASLREVGMPSFDSVAWRDVKDYLDSLDVWHLFCAVICGNFRVVLDGHESLSLGAAEVARMLQMAPVMRFVGHSEITAALSRWHDTFVLDEPTLLWSSCTCRCCAS
jgi:hypothetical protein